MYCLRMISKGGLLLNFVARKTRLKYRIKIPIILGIISAKTSAPSYIGAPYKLHPIDFYHGVHLF